ncbi:sigma-70 family RNA polymerase sigma factor [Pedobacter sp. GSP4]|uniref:sigma-70 family RNA polymerase sigma factor n=1 Tax=Pedobacter sp. GSP4 TaxID=3453716 RepID=UPI003EE8E9E8
MEILQSPTNGNLQRLAFEELLVSQLEVLKEMAVHFVRDQQEIEDLCQDTLLKALRFYEKFDMDTCIRKWLFTIMRNIFINLVNRASRGRNIDLALQSEMKGKYAENMVFFNLTENDIEDAIRRLAPAVREPIRMFNAGYKYREIAEARALPIGTVKTRIRTARIFLERIFLASSD